MSNEYINMKNDYSNNKRYFLFSFALHKTLNLRLSIDRLTITCKIFPIVQKNWVSRETPKGVRPKEERKRKRERVERRDSPYPPFVLLHALPREAARAAHRTERERRTRAQDEERSAREHPTSTLVATHRGIRIRGRSASFTASHLTSPHLASLQRSLLCILHWHRDLVVRFADAPPFLPFLRSIVFLQERMYVISNSHVPYRYPLHFIAFFNAFKFYHRAIISMLFSIQIFI